MTLLSQARIFASKALMCSALLGLSACASLDGSPSMINMGDGQAKSGIDPNLFVTEFPEVSINQIAQNTSKDIFKIGDTADVNVYNVETLTSTYIVDRDGKVSFPLIGTLQVAGLSTTQLQQTLTERYGARYLNSPSINVKLETQILGRVVVDGAVNKPGAFEISEIIKLSEAIARAEGLNTVNTNGGSVFIVRTVNGERKVLEVDLRQIREFGSEDPQLIPEDVVFVQDSRGRILFNEFLKTVPLINTAVLYGTRT